MISGSEGRFVGHETKFVGYRWLNGSWHSDNTIINGLKEDPPSYYLGPTAFYINNSLYLLVGNYTTTGHIYGYKWKDKDVNDYKSSDIKLPNSILEASEDIIDETLSCEVCGKNYKIIKNEFNFLKSNKIPPPKKCSNCRYKERLLDRNTKKLYDRKCMKCGKDIRTTYSPERKEIIYCEDCYLKEVY